MNEVEHEESDLLGLVQPEPVHQAPQTKDLSEEAHALAGKKFGDVQSREASEGSKRRK